MTALQKEMEILELRHEIRSKDLSQVELNTEISNFVTKNSYLTQNIGSLFTKVFKVGSK